MKSKSKREKPIPKGCTDVWRVYKVVNSKWECLGIFSDKEYAYRVAETRSLSRPRARVVVEHKAAILISGKTYLVNVLPIKVDDSHIAYYLPDTVYSPSVPTL